MCCNYKVPCNSCVVSVLTAQCKVECIVCTYGAMRDPLLVTVLLRPAEFLSQLGSVDVGVQLSY